MTRARFEYLEMLRPLQRRIANQRAELRRLQAYELWYAKYVWGGGPFKVDIPPTPPAPESEGDSRE